MTTALDLYAMVNPALGSALLWAFLTGAESPDPQVAGVEFPLLFLPIPVILSSSLASTFAGTNARTGFYAWLERHPEVAVGLADRINRSADLTRSALLFAGRTRLMVVEPTGRFRATGRMSEPALRRDAGPAVRPLFPLAKRFGKWLNEVGSTRDVLYALGLTLGADRTPGPATTSTP